MAIKGKGRTHGRRVVAAPPRPPLMVRKKPFYARRSLWIAVGAVALAAILFGVFWGIRSRSESAKKEREIAAVDTYTNLVHQRFPADTEPAPPSGYIVFPTLSQDLDRLSKDKLPSKDAMSNGRKLASAAKASAQKIEEIDVQRIIPGEFAQTRLDILESQFLMVQAFRVYERIGGLIQSAAAAPAAQRKAIAGEAKELTSSANSLFARGNQNLVNVRVDLGIYEPLPLQPPQELIPPPPPSPSPKGKTKSKASPQPTPTASA